MESACAVMDMENFSPPSLCYYFLASFEAHRLKVPIADQEYAMQTTAAVAGAATFRWCAPLRCGSLELPQACRCKGFELPRAIIIPNISRTRREVSWAD